MLGIGCRDRIGAAAAFPKRFAVLFMGNGISPDHWWAKGAGAEMELGKTLAAAGTDQRERSTSSTVCSTRRPRARGFIPAMTGNLLSGVPIQKGAIIHGGISMDQVLANHIGQDTLQPSMVLACEQPMTGYHETNFSNAYSSHISWQSADSPVPNEIYPSLAFDSLFENRGSLRNISVLDRVKEQRREAEPQDQFDRQGEAGRISGQRARRRKEHRADARRQGQGRGAGPRTTAARYSR